MLEVFYKYCCCQAQSADIKDDDARDKDKDHPAAGSKRSRVRCAHEDGDKGQRDDHRPEGGPEPGAAASGAVTTDRPAGEEGKKDGRQKSEKRSFFSRRDSGGKKKGGSRQNKGLSVLDRVKVLEKPADPAAVAMKDGTKPKKRKPSSKAFEEFERSGIMIGFGNAPKKRSSSEDLDTEGPEGGGAEGGAEGLPGRRDPTDARAGGSASRGVAAAAAAAGEPGTSRSNNNSLTRLTDDEGIHTMDEDDEFAAVTRNTEILKSFRRAPPPKNRTRARRSLKKRAIISNDFQDIPGFDSPQENEEDPVSVESRPTPSHSSESMDLGSGRGTPEAGLGDSGATSGRDTPETTLSGVTSGRATPETTLSGATSPEEGASHTEEAAKVPASATGLATVQATGYRLFVDEQQPAGRPVQAATGPPKRASPEKTVMSFEARRMPDRLKGRRTPERQEQSSLTPETTVTRISPERLDARHILQSSELRYSPRPLIATQIPDPGSLQPKTQTTRISPGRDIARPADDRAPLSRVTLSVISGSRGGHSLPSATSVTAKSHDAQLDSGDNKSEASIIRPSSQQKSLGGNARFPRHSVAVYPMERAATNTNNNGMINTRSSNATASSSTADVTSGGAKKSPAATTAQRPKSFHCDSVFSKQPMRGSEPPQQLSTNQSLCLGNREFFTENPLSRKRSDGVGESSSTDSGQADNQDPGVTKTTDLQQRDNTVSSSLQGINKLKEPFQRLNLQSGAPPSCLNIRRLPYREEMDQVFRQRYNSIREARQKAQSYQSSQPVIKFLIDKEPTNV